MIQESTAATVLQSPKSSLFRLAIPIILGDLSWTLYNFTDTLYVSRLGQAAVAGLGYSVSFFLFLISISVGLNIGANALVARYMGAKDVNAATEVVRHAFILALISSLILIPLGLLFTRPLLTISGATGQILTYAADYIHCMLFAVPFFLINTVFVASYNGTGKTNIPFKVTVFASIFNIVVDPLFIFTFNMGVKGAALASALSAFLSFVIYVYLSSRPVFPLKWVLTNFSINKDFLRPLLTIGFPSSVNLWIVALGFGLINFLASHFGTEAVAMVGIAFKIEGFQILLLISLSTSAITVVGMLKGAGKTDDIWSFSKFYLAVSAGTAVMMGTIFIVFSDPLFSLFSSSEAIKTMGKSYFTILFFQYPFFALTLASVKVLQGLGSSMPQLTITTFEFVFALGLGYLGAISFQYGLTFVWMIWVLASILSSVFGIMTLFNRVKKLC